MHLMIITMIVTVSVIVIIIIVCKSLSAHAGLYVRGHQSSKEQPRGDTELTRLWAECKAG